MAEPTKTGIAGLDELFSTKGFKANSSILISGEPGAGKSIFSMQFIYNGAKQHGEPGIFVSSEQSAEKIRENSADLSMSLEELEKKGLVTIVQQPVLQRSMVGTDSLVKIVREKKAKRVVLDSLTLFKYIGGEDKDFRLKVLEFLNAMIAEGVTLLVTSERRVTDFDKAEYTAEDFLFDGLIILGRMRRTISFERVLTIVKMRGAKHSEDIHPMEITSQGIRVKKV